MTEENTPETESAPASRKAGRPPKHDATLRTPLNHLKTTDNTEYEMVGGLKFRKNRDILDHSAAMRLDIPKNLLHPELNYHWINDVNGKVQSAEKMGYARVPPKHFEDSAIKSTEQRVGTDKNGQPIYAYLMACPKKDYEARHKLAEKNRREKEVGIAAGKTDGKEDLTDKNFYNKGSSITRG